MKKFLTHIFNNTEKLKSFNLAHYSLNLFVLSSLLFVAACDLSKVASSSNNVSSNSSSTISSNSSVITSGTTGEHALQLTTPRMLQYANLQFTVTKAVISKRTAEDQSEDSSNPAVADITLSVINTLKEAGQIRSGLWELRLGDGTIYKQPYSDDFEARDTKERKISFHVPLDAKWDGAKLTLDEQDKEPATLLLDGTPTQSLYPAKLNVGGEATTKEPVMTYTITSANVDVDDGFGHRAAVDKRFLNLSVRVANKETGNGGAFLPEFFRLLIDGVSSSPGNMGDSNIVESRSSQEIMMSFLIPANATSIVLEVGKPDIQATAKIPIDFKAVKSGVKAAG